MENITGNINQGRPVYFSYARNSSRKPEWEHISDCVETLLETMTAKNLEYRVDVKDIGMGDKISQFEEEIGWNSEVVVIIFSDKYFRSMHCMYEFVQIKNALKQYPQKRLMCIKSGNFNLSDINYIMELEDYWNDQKKEYEKIEYHRLRNHSGTEIAAHESGFYLEDIRNLYSFFSAINYSNAANINYDGFVGDIIKYYNTTPKPALTPKPKAQKLAKTEHQPTSTPQSATKKSPIIPIVLAAVVVVALAVFLLTGKTATTEQTATPDNTDNNGDVAALVTPPTDNDTPQEDDDAIFNKADALSNAGNYSEAVVYYEKLANKGNRAAQFNTGVCYEKLGNYEKAAEWYQKAADQGDASAQYNLGIYYYKGDGVTKDFQKTVYWFQRAADQGYANAQFNLGNFYCDGIGVTQSYEKAVEWYQKAADQGHAGAQGNLGNCYYYGNGVTQNYKKAVELYQKATDQGNAGAQGNLGDCYYYGRGVTKDYKKAVEWYQKAADQGNASAQYSLGFCYLYGQGVTKDINKAKEWLQKAASQGNEAAIEELKKL
ncbi:MAG: SEL1-like repeat protein [Bacteroidales bacterium]|nr:SEL1-like repeat protein [Bacteroidales bacterium]